jgi:hypothetical protein
VRICADVVRTCADLVQILCRCYATASINHLLAATNSTQQLRATTS